MEKPVVTTPTKKPVKALSQAAIYAERAMETMRTLSVLPTPKNYSIFFAYAAGQPTELVRDIDLRIANKTYFSEDLLSTFYNSFIAEAQTRAVQDSAANAKKILSEMMQSVSAYAGATTTASKDIAEKLEQLDDKASEEMVRMFATTLVERASTIQNSSETMTARLAGAQQEIMVLRENLARVVTESERDFLTGSFNRKAFEKRLKEAMAEAKKHDTELTLLMIDIDHFKSFNDNYGHLIGDEVLKTVAKTLFDSLKGTDSIARYGGEEFAVILPRTPLSGGAIVAEMIRKTIASKELKHKATGANFGIITVSIGVAIYRHEEDTQETFIARADEGLYRSKAAGRNRVSAENAAG